MDDEKTVQDEQTETEDLTTDERADMDETGASAEESHRIGEFDFMRERMDTLERMLSDVLAGIAELRTNAAALAVDNGAYAIDVDGDGDADVINTDSAIVEIPDYADLDLDL